MSGSAIGARGRSTAATGLAGIHSRFTAKGEKTVHEDEAVSGVFGGQPIAFLRRQKAPDVFRRAPLQRPVSEERLDVAAKHRAISADSRGLALQHMLQVLQ